MTRPRPAGRLAVLLAVLVASVLIASVLVVGGPSAAPPARADDAAVIETGVRLASAPEPDGAAVSLEATLLTTDPATPRPAVVLAHGFGGSQEDSREAGRDLARLGYAVVIYTARGFGGSGGRIHLGNPAYEGVDAITSIDFAASRAEVLRRGGDPVIGFAGVSYGGAAALLAAGLDPRVDAVVPAFTWHSLTQALFPQYRVAGGRRSLAEVTPAGGPGVFKQRWAALLFGSGGAAGPAGTGAGSPPALCGRFDPALCRAYLATAETGRPTPAMLDLLEASDLGPLVAKITAPTLLIAGAQDTLFPLDQADATLRALPPGTTAKMVWLAGGHDAGIALAELMPRLEEWFGRHLAGDGTPADTTFELAVPRTALVGSGNGFREPVSYTAAGYPGRGADLAIASVALAGEPQRLLSPPGGTPAALTSLPGTGNALTTASSFGGYGLGVLPGQAATFTSAPLSEPMLLAGSGRVRLEVTSSADTATLFVSVWDLGPDVAATPAAGGRGGSTPGTAVLPQLAVAPVRLSGLDPDASTEVEIALPPVVHQVPVGHRLQLVVSSTDQAYAVPLRPAGYTVGLAGTGELSVPALAARRAGAGRLDVPLPLVVAVAVLVLAALAAGTAFWLRRRVLHPRPDLVDVPLVADRLVKSYRGGIRAVDGVSFTARSGQVVGLLGPNGAGKTTALRMLVGLIRPDAGQAFVHGEPVHAGAEVLSEVGALIEGPGFLPHLSGRENLRAYWAATGRPEEEAGLAEVLRIAGLGRAVDRPVRGYSQGMRQRLGIAQAMLGRPSLLVLDEPTNGLDPPQIKAMRTVLQGYAADGRTVVVSSHLLAEVQQTCSHVVVMHRGRVVLTGSMAELTASQDVTVIGLVNRAEIAGARAVLDGLGASTAESEGLIKVSGPVPRPRLVAALVAAGFAIDSVDGHRQLEEVFLSLVGAPDGDRG